MPLRVTAPHSRAGHWTESVHLPLPKGMKYEITGKLCKKGMMVAQGGKDGEAVCQQKDLWVITE